MHTLWRWLGTTCGEVEGEFFTSISKIFKSVFRSEISHAILRDKSPYLNLFCLLTCFWRSPLRVWCISPIPVAAFAASGGWCVRFRSSDCFWNTLNSKLVFHDFSHFLPFFKSCISMAQFYEIRSRLWSFLASRVAWSARITAIVHLLRINRARRLAWRVGALIEVSLLEFGVVFFIRMWRHEEIGRR